MCCFLLLRICVAVLLCFLRVSITWVLLVRCVGVLSVPWVFPLFRLCSVNLIWAVLCVRAYVLCVLCAFCVLHVSAPGVSCL